MSRLLRQIKNFIDTISKEREYAGLLLFTLPIFLGLMNGEFIFGGIGIVGIIITVLLAIFNGIAREIISDRNKVYPKINKEIKKEFAKYGISSEEEKIKVINTIKELDTFRIRLRNIRKTRNHGFLFILFELFLLIVVLGLLTTFPFSLLVNQYTITLPSTIFIFTVEALLFIPLIVYRDFSSMWKVNQVLIEHLDNKNEDLTEIVCKIFKTHRKKS
ncbi:MAG: hypothetical protein QW257_01615 [Candidatus Micrarchaeaceae archaeon]